MAIYFKSMVNVSRVKEIGRCLGAITGETEFKQIHVLTRSHARNSVREPKVYFKIIL